jgi:hypothetical protein
VRFTHRVLEFERTGGFVGYCVDDFGIASGAVPPPIGGLPTADKLVKTAVITLENIPAPVIPFRVFDAVVNVALNDLRSATIWKDISKDEYSYSEPESSAVHIVLSGFKVVQYSGQFSGEAG